MGGRMSDEIAVVDGGGLSSDAGAGAVGGGSDMTPSPASSYNGNGNGHDSTVSMRDMRAAAQPSLSAPQSWRREIADRHWSRLDPKLQRYVVAAISARYQ
jgi:hypothetical protein